MSRKDLPSPGSTNYLARVRETLQTYLGVTGDPKDRGLTVGDLIEIGLVKLRSGGKLTNGQGTLPLEPVEPEVEEPDLTPPPDVSGLTATPAISHVIVEHDAPIYFVGHGHLRTRLYGATRASSDPEPVFADAVEVAQFSGAVYALPSNPGTIWHLWAKWESNDGVLSADPAGGTNGVEATTGLDVTSMVEAMTGPGNPFTILEDPTSIGDVTYPAGIYASGAFIFNGQIVNAMISNLAVDNAKIANMSVAKLTAGSISVGEYIQSTGYVSGSSGWRINGDGTAEFSGVVVRGTIYASAGQIGGITIGSTYIRSSSYSLGSAGWNLNSDGTGQLGGLTLLNNALQSWNFSSGSAGWRLHQDGSLEANAGIFRGNLHGGQFTTGQFTAYAWPPSGGGGSYLGPNGLLLGNGNDGRYFQVTYQGNLYAPGLSIVNGVMTISAANVIDTLNIAGNAVTVPVGASSSSLINLPSAWADTAISVAINPQSAPVALFGMLRISAFNEGSSLTTMVRLYRNATLLYEFSGPSNSMDTVPIAYFDASPGAGTHTYAVTLQANQGGATCTTRALVALGARR